MARALRQGRPLRPARDRLSPSSESVSAMPILLLVIILGMVEGLTEYLPVSSTGHLILATELLGFQADKWALFNVAIQPGAILAIVVLYWRTFRDVLVGLFQRDATALRFLRNLLIAFAPAVVLGVALGDHHRRAARKCRGRRLGADHRRHRDHRHRETGQGRAPARGRPSRSNGRRGHAQAVDHDRAGPVPRDHPRGQPLGRDDHGRGGDGHRPQDRRRLQLLPRRADPRRGDRAAIVQASATRSSRA